MQKNHIPVTSIGQTLTLVYFFFVYFCPICVFLVLVQLLAEFKNDLSFHFVLDEIQKLVRQM